MRSGAGDDLVPYKILAQPRRKKQLKTVLTSKRRHHCHKRVARRIRTPSKVPYLVEKEKKIQQSISSSKIILSSLAGSS